MNKLFHYAEQYLKESTWKDLALIKLCLCAIGILIGISVPKTKKKPVIEVTLIVFLATYIPLMYKFIKIITRKDAD